MKEQVGVIVSITILNSLHHCNATVARTTILPLLQHLHGQLWKRLVQQRQEQYYRHHHHCHHHHNSYPSLPLHFPASVTIERPQHTNNNLPPPSPPPPPPSPHPPLSSLLPSLLAPRLSSARVHPSNASGQNTEPHLGCRVHLLRC